ncbi:MAG TPA: hypothetical protein VGM33_19865 [Baekduia sp.]|jgi:hypothetical protein
MRRRLTLLVAVLCLAALGVTAVALASGGKDGAKQAHAPALHGIAGMVLTSLAGRLDVKPADLESAIKAVVAEQRQKLVQTAGLTPAETSALQRCRTATAARRHATGIKKRDAARVRPLRKPPAACASDAAKSAQQKLQDAAAKPDLVALKADVAQSLATRLGKTPDEILTAVRAELDQRLTQAVAIGLVTQAGHDLALACFDDPATCDLTALRSEVHLGHSHAKAPAGDGHTPGQMTPGGRSSSAPLR